MAATQYTFNTISVTNQTQESTLGEGSLAGIYRSSNSGLLPIDVVGQYAWTLSPPINSETCSAEDSPRSVAPVIELREFEINESTISRQLQFYFDAAFTGARDYLAAYDDLFPKDQTTNLLYRLPYFSDTQFEVNSPPWQSLDTAEQLYQGAKNIVAKGVGFFFGAGAGEATEKIIDYAESATKAGLALGYPKVGIMDRPKLWTNHDFRNITFSFPLFNTHNFDETKPEWKKNRELCFLLTYQNLFNKRSFITGIPPVFYEVLIPGQHFSIASCITNITVYNRGNMRLMYDSENQTSVNVPDVYEVNITLTDMVMPSKNQLQAAFNEQVRSSCRVNSGGT